MFEQTKSENQHEKINGLRRKEIGDVIAYKWESEEKRDEELTRREIRNRTFGNTPQMFIIEGSNDRISGVPYDDNKYSDVIKQNAYRDGFFRHGTQKILGKLEQLTEEDLEDIGYNDYISGVDYQALPDKVSENQNYIAGYLKATYIQKSNRSK